MIQECLVDPVSVQRNHGPLLNGIDLAPAAGQHAADKTAVILGGISFSLGHAGILFGGFRSADCYPQPFLQIVITDGFIDPGLRLPAVAVRNRKIPHYLASRAK